MIILGLAIGIGGCRTTHPDGAPRDSNAPGADLDLVPEPNDSAIRRIQDAEQWHNPYVIVNRDDYELILLPDPRTTERFNLSDLEKTLLKLPLARWPLGRVVAVQENSLGSKGDHEEINRRLKELKKMLESHKIRVDLWPI